MSACGTSGEEAKSHVEQLLAAKAVCHHFSGDYTSPAHRSQLLVRLGSCATVTAPRTHQPALLPHKSLKLPGGAEAGPAVPGAGPPVPGGGAARGPCSGFCPSVTTALQRGALGGFDGRGRGAKL